MKKALTIFVLLIAVLAARAQDRIDMKDGSSILASVKSITDQAVHYRPIITAAKGNMAVIEDTIHVALLDKVERITHASGTQLYPLTSSQTRHDTITQNGKYQLADRQISPYVVPQYKNPAYAFLLSTFPGCGQFYNDDISNGFAFMGAMIVESVVFGLSYTNLTTTETYKQNGVKKEREVTNVIAVGSAVISGVALIATYLWSSIDAVKTANRLNIINGYTVRLSPTFAYIPPTASVSNGLSAGLNLTLSF